MTDKDKHSQNIGQPIDRLESRDKVTGQTEYVHHLRLPGMLYGKIFRSSRPHAKILKVDTSAAAALEGVYRVVTIDDVRSVIPHPYYGPAFHDQPVLADGKVRFSGEPVAVVLAEDKHIAEQAVNLITIEYQDLPAVFDEVQAMAPDILVHDELKPAATFADLKHLKGRKKTNVALDYRLRRGDVEAGFKQSDKVFEHEFKLQTVMHATMEPLVSVADVVNGRVTLHTASQSPSFVRIEVARLLGWPENRVQVKVPFLGGGFGGKLYIKLECLVTALSLLVRRPVKISLTMEEQFFAITRHACTIRLKSGVSADGRVIARHSEVIWNGGAYADIGPRVTQKAGFTSAGPYDIENVAIESYAVYTNKPPAGALRGFGAPQTAWAYERHTDMIAEELGMDKLEFRRKNLLTRERPQATGTLMQDAAVAEVLDEVAKDLNWSQPFERGNGTIRRGRGLAVGLKGITSPTTSVAIVNLSADGSCFVSVGTVDMGQGSDTVMAQIAAEVLGLKAEDVRVIHSDTDVTPYDMATLGSRSTFHMGTAVKLAAEEALTKIAALRTELGLPDDSTASVSDMLKLKYGMQAGNIIGTGSFIPGYEKPDSETGQSTKATPFWGIGAAGAEVEVDTATGWVTVTKVVNVIDAGTVLNPKMVKQQISGAAIMQLGFTLTENMVFQDGQLTNGSLADYKIPNILDMPREWVCKWVDARQQDGPFGAKGAGEFSALALSPAIGNAVADALGFKLTDLPITPESIYEVLRQQSSLSKGVQQS